MLILKCSKMVVYALVVSHGEVNYEINLCIYYPLLHITTCSFCSIKMAAMHKLYIAVTRERCILQAKVFHDDILS